MEAFMEIYPDMNSTLLANVTRITIEKVRRIRGYAQTPQSPPGVGEQPNNQGGQQQPQPSRVSRRNSLLKQLLISKIAQKVSQMLVLNQQQQQQQQHPEAKNSPVNSDSVQSDQQNQAGSEQVSASATTATTKAANTGSRLVPQQEEEDVQKPSDIPTPPPAHSSPPPVLPIHSTAGSKRPSSSSSCDEKENCVDDRLSASVGQTATEQSTDNRQSRPKKSPRKSYSQSTAETVFVFPPPVSAPQFVTDVTPTANVEATPEATATKPLSSSQIASPARSPITRSLSEPHLTQDEHVPVQKLVGLSISSSTDHGCGQPALSYSAPEILHTTCKGCARCPPAPVWAPPTELRLCQPMTNC